MYVSNTQQKRHGPYLPWACATKFNYEYFLSIPVEPSGVSFYMPMQNNVALPLITGRMCVQQ